MNIFPKKSLGQNFLIDNNIIEKIINVLDIKDKSILEIGPGTGNLTKGLLKKKPKKTFLVEKDNKLVDLLKKKFGKKVSIINDDILNLDESSIHNDKLIVFGNLPYNISTEILCKWILNLSQKKIWFDYLILMFQKEVADRIISSHNRSDYGRLSIISNWRLNIKKICDISPGCFYPRPKVYSSLLLFSHKKKIISIKNPNNLEKITRTFFKFRRKMIKKSYKQLFKDNKDIIEKLKINLNSRPQNLDLNTYYKLTKEYEKLLY